jgi:hypothetical protein
LLTDVVTAEIAYAVTEWFAVNADKLDGISGTGL